MAGTGAYVSPDVDSPGEEASTSCPHLTGSDVDTLKFQVEWQRAYVRKLKEEMGRSNSAHTVQAQVQILLDLKVQILQDLKRKLGSLKMKQQNLRRIGQAEEAEAMSASSEISEDTTTATPQSIDDWLDSMPTKGNNKMSPEAAYLQNQPAHFPKLWQRICSYT
eukprot:gene12799-16057_t